MTQEEQILRDALAIIVGRGKWTQNALARDAYLEACPVHDPEAERWSAVGAIDKALGRFPKDPCEDPTGTTDRGIKAADYTPLRDRSLVALARGFSDWVHKDEEARYALRVIDAFHDDSLTELPDVVMAFARAIAIVRKERH